MNGRDAVCEAVEAFRTKHLGDQADLIPVDILTICEITLRLDVIPFPGLLEKFKIDAGIMPDFSGIYVDYDAYVLWERGQTWKQNRLRFSVAHELGHYALHREIASKIKHGSFEEFRDWFENEGAKLAVEQEANEFAGRLLVPLNRLEKYYDEFAARFDLAFPNWRETMDVRQRLTEDIAPKFGVNPDVISIRLDREGLWPVN